MFSQGINEMIHVIFIVVSTCIIYKLAIINLKKLSDSIHFNVPFIYTKNLLI